VHAFSLVLACNFVLQIVTLILMARLTRLSLCRIAVPGSRPMEA
jgi:hypothetical protein